MRFNAVVIFIKKICGARPPSTITEHGELNSIPLYCILTRTVRNL